MKFKHNLKLQKGHLDMTPLIDVVFQLLIFFMLSSSFIVQPGIKVDLPSAVSSETLENEHIIISITENKNIYLNEKHVKLNNLLGILSKKSLDSVIIQSDGNVPLSLIVSVWDICRLSGIKSLNIATNQKKIKNSNEII